MIEVASSFFLKMNEEDGAYYCLKKVGQTLENRLKRKTEQEMPKNSVDNDLFVNSGDKLKQLQVEKKQEESKQASSKDSRDKK